MIDLDKGRKPFNCAMFYVRDFSVLLGGIPMWKVFARAIANKVKKEDACKKVFVWFERDGECIRIYGKPA